jgi:hypothetical protein
MVHEIGEEGLLVLGNEPLVDGDEVVAVPLPSHDLLLEDIRAGEAFDVAAEVAETVELNDCVPQTLPLGHHDVADEVVEVVLHQAGHPQSLQQLERLPLRQRGVRFQAELLQGFMDLIAEVVDLRVGGAQVEVAQVEVHGLVERQGIGPLKAAFDQLIGVPEFGPIKQHA